MPRRGRRRSGGQPQEAERLRLAEPRWARRSTAKRPNAIRRVTIEAPGVLRHVDGFPPSDYYDRSVAMGLATRRRSRVRASST